MSVRFIAARIDNCIQFKKIRSWYFVDVLDGTAHFFYILIGIKWLNNTSFYHVLNFVTPYLGHLRYVYIYV